MENKKFSVNIEGQELKIEINQLAGRANASVLAQLGETVVLATCVLAKFPKEGVNYLPLSVDYEERFYAAGKIKGSRFVKREGRPSDEAILTSRLIDRAIRPLFDQNIRNSIQITITVLSYDGTNDPDILALNAASTALLVSDIPWSGPIAGARVGVIDNGFVFNPTNAQREKSALDAIIAGTKETINMLEIKASEIPEEKLVAAIEASQAILKNVINLQDEIQKAAGVPKIDLPTAKPEPAIRELTKNFIKDKLEKAIYEPELRLRTANMDQLKEKLMIYCEEKGKIEMDKHALANQIEMAIEEEVDKIIHRNTLELDKRTDGRGLNEIRHLSCRAGLLPRTHGSGLFERGETKVLSTVTLGSPGKKQLMETMEIEGEKHFMHHYNFPSFCVGETTPPRSPNRREIGHGALAEKALEPLIPAQESFPYTIRVVSEILSSNGSSSMASVCASSLALMDAGVPIKRPAAGIAVGLILDEAGKSYKILTDIQGPEDHHGDMDLKVAGTSEGIAAVQMDVKIKGLTIAILKDVFDRAKQARLEILNEMTKTIAQPRASLSPHAPIIITLQINPERIRDVIGPGGKIINKIIAETGVEIDIEDSGLIFVTAQNKEAAGKAIDWIKNLTHEVKPGEIFQGRVTRILDFGAMVEILPGQEGLVHISELAPYRVNKVSDIIKIGDIIPVKVKNIDELDRINLSLKDAQNTNQQNK